MKLKPSLLNIFRDDWVNPSLTFLYSHYTMGSQPEMHVIIVGGGIAGLATVTYRLLAYTDCEKLS